jgi:hypothetical protein
MSGLGFDRGFLLGRRITVEATVDPSAHPIGRTIDMTTPIEKVAVPGTGAPGSQIAGHAGEDFSKYDTDVA